MNDLLARLAQWKQALPERRLSGEQSDEWLSECERADLALDALDAFMRCDGGGCYHADTCGMGPCKAEQDARAILRELRGPSSGEGDSR